MLRRSQRGDTIVEVLISIAVIGMTLATAFSVTNRNNRSLQDVQERGQALKLAQTQVELLRAAATFDTGTGKCFLATGLPTNGATGQCVVDASGNPTTAEPKFTLLIQETSGVYKVTTTWSGLLNRTSDANVTIYYRP